jgi:hypothetical protein
VLNVLDLLAKENSGVVALVPSVDGVSLVDLVGAFEESQGFTPAGGYAGIIPAYVQLGDLAAYYRGIERAQLPQGGRLWLLGCDCGEVSCWPLEAEVTLDERSIWWSGFAQPYRPAWLYAGFGPFVFDRRQYEAAVAGAVAALGA